MYLQCTKKMLDKMNMERFKCFRRMTVMTVQTDLLMACESDYSQPSEGDRMHE